ncbi:hypothetical protein AI2828V5_3898 [Klebsiella oxytoca]|nr:MULTISPECIES: hypothetical protein [Klebsiella]AUV93260.1 hypothetical protein C2U44_20535 [Klebsiella oxytoca]KLY14840.1 hypothetical protein SK88_02160 [Klebsiella oxytoca]MDK6956940.1 hypothetical protein [Klebsiella michiganensis]MDK8021213.1 hypothetical protein [Klebsiella michiganensis]POT85534.1 hypothetical protein C3417_23225 [Klebsiella oxytoca]
MTSKLTREQLHERARENVKALKMASRQTAFESAREEILADLQLAELALAAMDSDPVFTLEVGQGEYKGQKLGNQFGFITLDAARKLEEGNYQLYAAQPAPVVPEEATPDSIEILASARRRDHAVFQWDEDQRNAAADSWNACRAAMLQTGTLTNEDTRQVDELTMWVKRLVRSLKKASPDSKLHSEAMDYLTTKGLISVGDALR